MNIKKYLSYYQPWSLKIMHLPAVSIQDVWKPNSIETMKFLSMILGRCYCSRNLNIYKLEIAFIKWNYFLKIY